MLYTENNCIACNVVFLDNKKMLAVNCRPGHDNNTVDFTCVYSYSFLLYLFRKVNEKLSELKVILLTVKLHNIVGHGTGNSSNDITV